MRSLDRGAKGRKQFTKFRTICCYLFSYHLWPISTRILLKSDRDNPTIRHSLPSNGFRHVASGTNVPSKRPSLRPPSKKHMISLDQLLIKCDMTPINLNEGRRGSTVFYLITPTNMMNHSQKEKAQKEASRNRPRPNNCRQLAAERDHAKAERDR
jgi:hypothetical protein